MQRLTPCTNVDAMFYSYEKSILRKKNPFLPTKKWSHIFAICIFMYVCMLVTCCILTVDFLLSFLHPLFPFLNTVLWHPFRVRLPRLRFTENKWSFGNSRGTKLSFYVSRKSKCHFSTRTYVTYYF